MRDGLSKGLSHLSLGSSNRKGETYVQAREEEVREGQDEHGRGMAWTTATYSSRHEEVG